jgi:hypothetical protein
LVNAFLLGGSVGSAFDDAETDFTGTGFDAVAAGWRLIPGPGAGLLIGLGLAGLAVQRR